MSIHFRALEAPAQTSPRAFACRVSRTRTKATSAPDPSCLLAREAARLAAKRSMHARCKWAVGGGRRASFALCFASKRCSSISVASTSWSVAATRLAAASAVKRFISSRDGPHIVRRRGARQEQPVTLKSHPNAPTLTQPPHAHRKPKALMAAHEALPAQSRRRCGTRCAQSRRRCGSGESGPGADVARGASPVPAQMWQPCHAGSDHSGPKRIGGRLHLSYSSDAATSRCSVRICRSWAAAACAPARLWYTGAEHGELRVRHLGITVHSLGMKECPPAHEPLRLMRASAAHRRAQRPAWLAS